MVFLFNVKNDDIQNGGYHSDNYKSYQCNVAIGLTQGLPRNGVEAATFFVAYLVRNIHFSIFLLKKEIQNI